MTPKRRAINLSWFFIHVYVCLNIVKSNYVIFRPLLVNYSVNLKINNQTLMHENYIKY